MTDLSGPPSAPNVRTVSVTFDLSRLPGVATAFGVALVSSAIVVSAVFSRRGDQLDDSIFWMGLLATAGLLVVAIGAQLLLADADRRAALVSWPGAAGIVGAGIMLAVAIDRDSTSTYAAGALILAASALGYVVTKAAPFVLTAILGLAMVYIQAFFDVIDFDDNGTNALMIGGAAILVFVGGVTALGWLLPRTRVLTAVVVGIGAILAFSGVFQAMVFFGTVATSYSISEGDYSSSCDELQGDPMDDPYVSEGDPGFTCESPLPADDFYAPGHDNSYRSDIWVVLSYSAALALFWAFCALATGHVAFRILSATILTLSVPAGIIALSVSHTTWWQVGVTALGGLVLAAVGLRTMKAPTPPTA